jgi:hypothetical protein
MLEEWGAGQLQETNLLRHSEPAIGNFLEKVGWGCSLKEVFFRNINSYLYIFFFGIVKELWREGKASTRHVLVSTRVAPHPAVLGRDTHTPRHLSRRARGSCQASPAAEERSPQRLGPLELVRTNVIIWKVVRAYTVSSELNLVNVFENSSCYSWRKSLCFCLLELE